MRDSHADNVSQIRGDYLQWIYEKLGFTRSDIRRFGSVCDRLLDVPFFWLNEMDENRADDGLHLRREYFENDRSEQLFGDVSVLEVLTEFAIRIDSEYIGDPGDPDPRFIFIEFMKNLGFDRCENVKKNGKTFFKERILEWITKNPGMLFGFKTSPVNAHLWELMQKWAQNV